MATLVYVILDESGSMEAVRDATIDGFNEYINELKVSKGRKKINVTLNKFDRAMMNPNEPVVRSVFTETPVDEVPELTREAYVPRGSTPLYDAIGSTLADVKERKKDRVLFVIITDGYENSSSEYNRDKIRDMVKEREDRGNWTFVYLGANQDAFAVGNQFGMKVGNTMNYSADQAGVKTMFRDVAMASSAYLSVPVAATANFFKNVDADKDESR